MKPIHSIYMGKCHTDLPLNHWKLNLISCTRTHLYLLSLSKIYCFPLNDIGMPIFTNINTYINQYVDNEFTNIKSLLFSDSICADKEVMIATNMNGNVIVNNNIIMNNFIDDIKDNSTWSISSIHPHTNIITHNNQIDTTQDSLLVAIGSNSHIVSIYDVFKPEAGALVSLVGHDNNVPSVDIDSTCNFVVSCSIDKSIILWDINQMNNSSNGDLSSDNKYSLITKAKIDNDWGWSVLFYPKHYVFFDYSPKSLISNINHPKFCLSINKVINYSHSNVITEDNDLEMSSTNLQKEITDNSNDNAIVDVIEEDDIISEIESNSEFELDSHYDISEDNFEEVNNEDEISLDQDTMNTLLQLALTDSIRAMPGSHFGVRSQSNNITNLPSTNTLDHSTPSNPHLDLIVYCSQYHLYLLEYRNNALSICDRIDNVANHSILHSHSFINRLLFKESLFEFNAILIASSASCQILIYRIVHNHTNFKLILEQNIPSEKTSFVLLGISLVPKYKNLSKYSHYSACYLLYLLYDNGDLLLYELHL